MRISAGEKETLGMVAQVLHKFAGLQNATFCNTERGLNISFCKFTTNQNNFTVLAYNPQGRQTTQALRIPIQSNTAVVKSFNGSVIESVTIPLTNREKSLSLKYLLFPEMSDQEKVAQFTNNATHVLTFVADLPAVGYRSFQVSTGLQPPTLLYSSSHERQHTSEFTEVGQTRIIVCINIYSVGWLSHLHCLYTSLGLLYITSCLAEINSFIL